MVRWVVLAATVLAGHTHAYVSPMSMAQGLTNINAGDLQLQSTEVPAGCENGGCEFFHGHLAPQEFSYLKTVMLGSSFRLQGFIANLEGAQLVLYRVDPSNQLTMIQASATGDSPSEVNIVIQCLDDIGTYGWAIQAGDKEGDFQVWLEQAEPVAACNINSGELVSSVEIEQFGGTVDMDGVQGSVSGDVDTEQGTLQDTLQDSSQVTLGGIGAPAVPNGSVGQTSEADPLIDLAPVFVLPPVVDGGLQDVFLQGIPDLSDSQEPPSVVSPATMDNAPSSVQPQVPAAQDLLQIDGVRKLTVEVSGSDDVRTTTLAIWAACLTGLLLVCVVAAVLLLARRPRKQATVKAIVEPSRTQRPPMLTWNKKFSCQSVRKIPSAARDQPPPWTLTPERKRKGSDGLSEMEKSFTGLSYGGAADEPGHDDTTMYTYPPTHACGEALGPPPYPPYVGVRMDGQGEGSQATGSRGGMTRQWSDPLGGPLGKDAKQRSKEMHGTTAMNTSSSWENIDLDKVTGSQPDDQSPQSAPNLLAARRPGISTMGTPRQKQPKKRVSLA